MVDTWEPRTDVEMARSLLMLPEQEHLDFKERIDFSDKKSALSFVKDAVAMANTHPGGHIIVGFCDGGSWPEEPVHLDQDIFDSAALRDQIAAFIDAPISVRSQIHSIDGHEVAIVAVKPGPDMLPIPMSKQGNYAVKDKNSRSQQRSVFRKGDVFLREGSQNVVLRSAHWNTLLAAHDQSIRAEARANVDAILGELAQSLVGNFGTVRALPLNIDNPEKSLSASIGAYLNSDDVTPVRLLLQQAVNSLPANREKGLRVWAIGCVQALIYNQRALVVESIDMLHEAYLASYQDDELVLDILVYLYVVGAAAVRNRRWSELASCVLRAGKNDNYRSWIRDGQVTATRLRLFPDGALGLMIDMAYGLMSTAPALRPDIAGELPLEAIPSADPALNSLCQFDFCQMLLQELSCRPQSSRGYTACSAFSYSRIEALLEAFTSDQLVRESIAQSTDEQRIGEAFIRTFSSAESQSTVLGNWWTSPSDQVRAYIARWNK